MEKGSAYAKVTHPSAGLGLFIFMIVGVHGRERSASEKILSGLTRQSTAGTHFTAPKLPSLYRFQGDMSPIPKDRYYHVAPCTFELSGGQMKLGDPLLTSRPPRACKVCGSPDKTDFQIPNDVWKTVVPTEFQNKVVCVECFGKFACEKQVDLFRGYKETVGFGVNK